VRVQERYKTLLVIVTGLIALSKIFDLPVLINAALIVGLITIFIEAAAKGLEWLWIKLALGLGWINSRVILSIVFFGFLLPMAWFSRWFRNDVLNLKRQNGSSVYHTRNYKYRKKDLENIW
jgi:hypothetical protein